MALTVLLLAIVPCALAFPPAPHHLFVGIVRDELGNPIQSPSSEVMLVTESGRTVSTPIIKGLRPGANYQLAVPMDAGITADLYKPGVMRTALPFTLKVKVGQTIYVPIEMTGDFASMGQPGVTTVINLTLGEDSDGDGLPDAWERALLAQAGGTLQDILPGGDFDRDGANNLSEFISGTYAFDSKDGFSLQVRRSEKGKLGLEFLAISGRTYTLYGSTDIGEWKQESFRLSTDDAALAQRLSFQPSESKVVRFELGQGQATDSVRFFKLRVE